MISTNIVAAGLTAALVVLPLNWARDREPPTHILSATIDELAVPQGGTLHVTYELSRDRDPPCDASVVRTIFDGRGVEWRVGEDSRPAFGPVGEERKTIPIPIPNEAFPGPARYRLVRSFVCNPIHRYILPIKVVEPDLPFLITAKEKP